VNDPALRGRPVATVMEPAFPFVDICTSLDALATMITPANSAVLVRDFQSDETFILTRWDVLQALGGDAESREP
jgi:cystathionine beta-synthase